MALALSAPLADAQALEGRSAGHHWRHWGHHSAHGTGRGAGRRNARQPEAPVTAAPQADAAPQPEQGSPRSGPALVGIAAGGITSTSARVASDLAAVLDSDDLRILPLMTRSSLPDLIALAAAERADLAFLHADAPAALPEAERARTSARLAYVARLYNEEVHVVAATGIRDIHDLAGRKVNIGPPGSDNAQTATLIFDRLGIVADFVMLDQPTALAKLAAGDIAADVLVSGRPVKALQDFGGDGRFKLLPIPFEASLQNTYLPAQIDAVDYGNLVPSGTRIETLAVPIVLATVDATAGSARAARVARFTAALFDRFDALRDAARHPKWRDVNLAADVANWTRFPAAQEAIDKRTARSVGLEHPVVAPADAPAP